MVAIQIFQHRGIPRQRLFAWEVAFNHRAATALNGRALLIAHCSFGDIAERNGWQTSWPAAFSVSISCSRSLMRAESLSNTAWTSPICAAGPVSSGESPLVIGGKCFVDREQP